MSFHRRSSTAVTCTTALVFTFIIQTVIVSRRPGWKPLLNALDLWTLWSWSGLYSCSFTVRRVLLIFFLPHTLGPDTFYSTHVLHLSHGLCIRSSHIWDVTPDKCARISCWNPLGIYSAVRGRRMWQWKAEKCQINLIKSYHELCVVFFFASFCRNGQRW